MSQKSFVLLLPLLHVVSCGGDDTTSTQPPQGETVTVNIRDNFFEPKSVRINPGTTVRWVLRGQMTNHAVRANKGEWDSGFIFRQQGAAFAHTFTMADNNQTFLYNCPTHWISDGMQGSVVVGANAPAPPPRY